MKEKTGDIFSISNDRVRDFIKENKTIYCSIHCPEGYLNIEQHKIMNCKGKYYFE